MPTTVTKRQPHDPWQCMAQMPKPIQLRCWDQARINYDGTDTKGKKKLTQEEEKALREKTKAPSVQAALAEAQAAVAGRGRAFLRPSGTEPVVRVTVEADDAALMQRTVDALAEAVRNAAA